MKIKKIAITLLICLGPSLSTASQSDQEAMTNEQLKMFRQKHQNTSSSQLGNLLVELQRTIHSKASERRSWADMATPPEKIEQNAILQLLSERTEKGDYQAGHHFSNWLAGLCMHFLRIKLKHASDSYCEAAEKELKAQAGRGDPRAMERLGDWYESGTHFEKSNYVAAEWYVKVMRAAIAFKEKSLASSFLEKIDRLYPRYPDLDTYRRQILSMP
jgi:hypothetical protein